jgi:hypothetical protein
MNKPLTIECAFHVGHQAKGRKGLLAGREPALTASGSLFFFSRGKVYTPVRCHAVIRGSN